MIKCRLYYCKLRRTRAPHQKFTVVNMMYVCKHRRFTIVKYCCVHLSLIKFFIICRVWSVCDSGLCRCSWPRPPSAAGVRAGFSRSRRRRAASPAHGLAPRPAPRGGGVFPFFWGSVLFVLFFLFSRPPKAAAGGCRPSGRRPSFDAPDYPRKVLRGQICPLHRDFFFQ